MDSKEILKRIVSEDFERFLRVVDTHNARVSIRYKDSGVDCELFEFSDASTITLVGILNDYLRKE